MEGNTPKGQRRSTALLTAYTSRNLKWNERIEAFQYAGLLNGLLATFPRGNHARYCSLVYETTKCESVPTEAVVAVYFVQQLKPGQMTTGAGEHQTEKLLCTDSQPLLLLVPGA